MRIAKKIKAKIKGFTLIELLVVVGILAVLLAIVLLAINPWEQINKARDVATQSFLQDFASSNKYYFTSEKTLPWKKDSACRNELATGNTVYDIPTCVAELTKGGKLEESVMNSAEAKDTYVTECSDSLAICYGPASSQFLKNSDAKYTKNGVLNPQCPGNTGCYSCEFTTNQAQECFQALNPKGSLAIVPSPSPNDLLPIPNRNSKHTCSDTPPAGAVSCMGKVVTDSSGNPLSSISLPGGFGPEQLHAAYNLPCTPGGPINAKCDTPSSFGPQTIAIVDAYHTPTLEQDLSFYNQTYGLPPCTVTNGCLTILNQNGTTLPVPPVDGNWALETSLDVQMAHAICQTCKILVIEASSNYFTDLGTAVNKAAQLGAHAISNSYGARDWSGQVTYDSYYNHPGIFVTASSGDWGYGTYYPSSSAHVIGVGGTTLSLYANNSYASESVWSGAGSGCTLYATAQSYQSGFLNWNATGCGAKRGVSDVSAVANPSTGVAVYDTTAYSDRSGWWILGGTSVSSPIISAVLAMTGSAPATGDASSYIYSNSSKFRDITTGNNGSCSGTTACTAGVGYDGPTGIGSPHILSDPEGINPTLSEVPTSAPTIVPTLTLTPTPISSPSGTPGPLSGFIVDVINKTISKVSYTANQAPLTTCAVESTTMCSGTPIVAGKDAVSQCSIQNTGYAIFSTASCPTLPTPTPTASPTPISTPTPTPTPITTNCTTFQTVTLAQSQPVLALPGDTVVNSLTVKNNDSINCPSLLYTISQGYPSGWTVSGIPASFNLAAGATKTINFTVSVPANATAGNYGYQFWVAKPGQTNLTPVNGSIQVEQVGPTNTPTPTPISCTHAWSQSLGSTSLSGNAGDTLNESITLTNNNPPSCGSALFVISYAYPSGWIINGLQPPSISVAGGETKTLPITISISTGALVQDYLLQFWVNNGGNNMNATVHVLNTATPPEEQLFSNFNVKPYGNYALFEYSYNATGAVSGRLDVATDPSALNQTTGPNSFAMYGFASNYGGAMDASNNPIPSSVRGFIVSSPQSWSGWQCGHTIYYRMYNSGDMRIKSPILSTVVNCTTVVDVLPWNPWYAAIYQGVYDARYDADNNGIINYTDYWILVRATRLR